MHCLTHMARGDNFRGRNLYVLMVLLVETYYVTLVLLVEIMSHWYSSPKIKKKIKVLGKKVLFWRPLQKVHLGKDYNGIMSD